MDTQKTNVIKCFKIGRKQKQTPTQILFLCHIFFLVEILDLTRCTYAYFKIFHQKKYGPGRAGHCRTSGVPCGTNAADSAGIAHDPGEGGDGKGGS